MAAPDQAMARQREGPGWVESERGGGGGESLEVFLFFLCRGRGRERERVRAFFLLLSFASKAPGGAKK